MVKQRRSGALGEEWRRWGREVAKLRAVWRREASCGVGISAVRMGKEGVRACLGFCGRVFGGCAFYHAVVAAASWARGQGLGHC